MKARSRPASTRGRPRPGRRPPPVRPAPAAAARTARRRAAPAAPRRPRRRAPVGLSPWAARLPARAAARPLRVGAGSITMPPAIVAWGAVSRITTWSPCRAGSGRSSRSCTRPAAPAAIYSAVAHRHPGRRLGGAVVDGHPFAVAQRPRGVGEHLDVALEPVAMRAASPPPPACRRAAPAPARRRPAPPPPAGRRPPLDRLVVHLHASHPHGPPARLDRQPCRRRRSVPDHSVPVTTVPIPRSVNARSIGSRTGPSAGGGAAASAAQRSSSARSSSMPATGAAETSTAGDAGQQLLDLQPRQQRGVVVDQVALGQRDHAALEAQQVAGSPGARGSAASRRRRRRPPAAHRSMPVAPASMVRTNRSWPGTSTHRQPPAVGQLQRA